MCARTHKAHAGETLANFQGAVMQPARLSRQSGRLIYSRLRLGHEPQFKNSLEPLLQSDICIRNTFAMGDSVRSARMVHYLQLRRHAAVFALINEVSRAPLRLLQFAN